ncbi:PA1414 family protein [Pseudomonas zhanjiangensis]|uniref:PA1414 family protein n=1 Tax=Pseudomonas zhanjiangensis TaxID=3239015 RepID=A0ABV3YT94_9PSED
MNAWLNRRVWQLLVALGLIERPRLQPVPVPSEAQRRQRPRE